MPRYTRSRQGELQRARSFEHPNQLLYFLSTATEEEFRPFKQIASEFLDGSRVPNRKLRRSGLQKIVDHKPRHLIPYVVHELQSHVDPDDESLLGGGIIEGIGVLAHQASHLLGLDVLKDKIFGAPPKKPIPLNSEVAAYLTDKTYLKPAKRPLKTVGYTRLPEYDSSYVSVWKNDTTGELTVTVRGTQLSPKDIFFDAEIMLGKTTIKSDKLDDTLNKIETRYPNQKYNIASHSLGSAFVMSEIPDHQKHVEDYFFFTPASSPLQSNDVLDKYANIPNATYYVNDGDLVSDTMRQRMHRDTLETAVYKGDYRYTPWASHSLSQWYPDFIEDKLKPPQPQYDRQDVDKLEPEAQLSTDNQESRDANLS